MYRQTCSLTRGAHDPTTPRTPESSQSKEWQLLELSLRGVDAVFDHLGQSSVKQSCTLLDQGGIFVVYGIAADLDRTAALALRRPKLLVTLALWSALPNGRRAMFYDF